MTAKWRKVRAPQTWRPTESGEELVGRYAGRTIKTGTYGQYEVITIAVPLQGVFMISGIRLIQLVDAAMLNTGDVIRIVFRGHKLCGEHQMKLFDLYVDEQPLDHVVPHEYHPRSRS